MYTTHRHHHRYRFVSLRLLVAFSPCFLTNNTPLQHLMDISHSAFRDHLFPSHLTSTSSSPACDLPPSCVRATLCVTSRSDKMMFGQSVRAFESRCARHPSSRRSFLLPAHAKYCIVLVRTTQARALGGLTSHTKLTTATTPLTRCDVDCSGEPLHSTSTDMGCAQHRPDSEKGQAHQS